MRETKMICNRSGHHCQELHLTINGVESMYFVDFVYYCTDLYDSGSYNEPPSSDQIDHELILNKIEYADEEGDLFEVDFERLPDKEYEEVRCAIETYAINNLIEQ